MDNDTPDRKIKRFELLIELFQCFADGYKKELRPSEELRLSYIQLYNIVESYFQDVDRYKQYHFDDPSGNLINDAKICAFTLKWCLRVRPLYVHNGFSVKESNPDSFKYDDYSLIMNELFCVFLAECFLKISLSDAKFGELLYFFRYRNPDEHALMPIFQMIIDLRRGHKIIFT